MKNLLFRAVTCASVVFLCAVVPGYSKDDKAKEKLQEFQQKLQQNQPKRENKPAIANPGNNDAGRKFQPIQQPQPQPRVKEQPQNIPNFSAPKDNPLRQRLENLQQNPPKMEQPKLQPPQGGPFGGGNNQPKGDSIPRNQPPLGNKQGLQPGNNPFNQPGNNNELKQKLEALKPKENRPQLGNPGGNNPLNQPGINPDLKNRLEGLKPKDGQPQFGNKPVLPGNQPGNNNSLNNPDFKNRLEGLKPKDGPPQIGNKPILPGNPPGKNPFDNPDLKNRLEGLKPKDGQPQLGNKPILPGNPPGTGLVNKGNTAPNLGKGFDLSNHLKTEMDKNPKLRERLESIQGNKGNLPGPDGKNILGNPGFKPGDKTNPLAGAIMPKVDLHKGAVPVKIDRNNLLESLKQQQGKGDTPNVLMDLQKHKGPRNDQDLQQMFAKLKDNPQFHRDDKLAGVDLDRVSGQFQHRLHRGDFQQANFNHFVNPQAQKHFAIDSQFALYQRGDVARQLNLNLNLINGGGWRARPIGPVFVNYTHNHFSSWYPGPSWCPQYCWTPQWSPWVSWSFWNWCVPVYDPRPFICRPIIYDPCPPIVIYQYPVWQPLPVVTCGTWVDVPPVVIDTGFDLELLAVRFVDPGHQEENLGPRYRVWIRNNSPAAIGAPFNVALVAANGPQLAGELPQAGTTVPSMDANSTIPVDIRLPLAANRLGRNSDGTVVPFSHLHILVDSHRDLAENNEANNGAVLERGTIYPVDPAGFSTDVTAASPGAMVSLAGEGFGPEPGQLLVTVNGQTQAAEVAGWYDLGIYFKVPDFNLAQSTDAQIIVVRGDSAVSNPVELDLAPQGWLQEAQLPPAPVPGANGPALPPAP